MTGPTLAMAPAVDARTPFHRSHSTPDLLSALPKTAPPSATSLSSAIHRANSFKSLPSLPAFDVPSFDIAEFESALTLDRKSAAATRRSASKQDVIPPPPTPTVSIVPADDDHRLSRSHSMIDRPRSWLPSSKSSPNVRTIPQQRPKSLVADNVAIAPPDDPPEAAPRLERSRTVESFADFAKRSWISSSRSPSPPSKADRAATTKSRFGLRSRANSASRLSATDSDEDASQVADSPSSKRGTLNRASVYLTKITQRPQSVFSKSTSSLSLSASGLDKHAEPAGRPPAPSSTITTAKLSSLAAEDNASRSSVGSSIPRNSSHASSSGESSMENASQSTADTSITMPNQTSKDPLWNTFRILDGDYVNFAAKTTTAARMNIVRSILIPFLHSTAHHPSNSNRSILSAEDVERRATILDRWWNGLLELLDQGQSSRPFAGTYGPVYGNCVASGHVSLPAVSLQPVSGADRPILLEATTMIMARPEWRLCTSSFQPLAERSPEERVRVRSNTLSTTNSDFDYLADSADQNVRNMFVTNLVTQMALAIDKMSLRHTPQSIVSWCGKACAYAFFFAPGIADVLVRLWVVNADLLRRAADEFGLPRKSRGESDDIVALFPPHLGRLGWTSANVLTEKLRQPARLPLTLAKIAWHGPWVTRWRGGDTDLFYIFCKYYHILSEEFIPDGLPLVEKARGPGFVLLHAHLLSIMDSTIHRQASIDAMLGPPMAEGMHGADAALGMALPSNLLKSMDENRIIVLLRDMLAESSNGVGIGIKHTFAEAFMGILKASTKRTSRYEHAPCFTLCDFLEVALLALDSFQSNINNSVATSPTEESTPSYTLEMAGSTRLVDYIDWAFWFDVGKMIMNSNNTMSEIRIMSFIFTVWDAITADPARKEALCLGWLLTEEIFEKFFNNWCPMVRAYYMRLLCWRVCRDSGSPNELDIKIFLTVSQRLRTVWSHYLWTKQNAEWRCMMPPSTAPCLPTPGKRFVIIRTEVMPPQGGGMPSFDSLPNPSSTSDPTSDYRALFPAATEPPKVDGTANKKKWSLLGKVLSFTAQQANGGAPSGKRTWDEELEQARRDTAASRAAARTGILQPLGPPPPPKTPASSGVLASSDSGSSTGSAPIFDAATYVFRFALSWNNQNGPSRDRILSRPRLPAPAHARVSARSANGGSAFRSDSPPPIAPGLPPETRRISGLMQTGLVSEARNARPLSLNSTPSKSAEEKAELKRLSLNVDVTSIRLIDGVDDDRQGARSTTPVFDGYESDRGQSFDLDGERGRPQPPAVRAVKPVGIYASGAVYTGRALAEWSLVVSECNSFVDRRRDEGVLGLSDVEIPALTVEGLGIRQRG
ncbi:hypothetical protein QBC47DRAFT_203717 [Echria macrotheca]|uniref:DUF1765-domain-containing protein n=1 Tax=Echria macrotheca TaxID=438768 RepID=A0AAJ0BAY3_9PEZI|nr:hypothetical protein QBC47DRAFT_203717 [Echria macrotheca]